MTYLPGIVSGPQKLELSTLRGRLLSLTTCTPAPGKVTIHHETDVTHFRTLDITPRSAPNMFDTCPLLNGPCCSGQNGLIDVRFLGLTTYIPGQSSRGDPFSGQQFRTKKAEVRFLGRITGIRTPRKKIRGDPFLGSNSGPKKMPEVRCLGRTPCI